MQFILVIDSNFGRISYRFRDIDAFSTKIAHFPTPSLFDAPLADERPAISTQSIYMAE